ncbi:OmpA family protein [Candidatus Albibeggiatoa sp. nov. NOAA]|uniref:OmpA family protein n=1 Tax=Candidatus Albibeggiatoa sp. nov. NOAA TaxID=3162724 RepID=UPI0032F9B234|nr:OmpA family protein [Thiotrichaceae bacterium]
MLLLILGANTYAADTILNFPTTADGFIQHLTPKASNSRQAKGLDKPKKGIAVIEEDQPKVGALILFDFDSANIKTESYALLNEFAKALKTGLKQAKFEIIGHTDNVGTEPYNLGLSIQRAKAVKDFLVKGLDIETERLEITGYGETKPIDSNATEVGRAQNRRVEFMRLN